MPPTPTVSPAGILMRYANQPNVIVLEVPESVKKSVVVGIGYSV